jgi:predicted transposase/invertase (TIGR01784 family)
MREMAMSDWTTAIDTATDKGIAIGKSEGIAIGKSEREIEIAQKMKDRGRPLEEIVEDTGLDIDTIKSLS